MNQCRLVKKTVFDFAQTDSHPERSRRLADKSFIDVKSLN